MRTEVCDRHITYSDTGIFLTRFFYQLRHIPVSNLNLDQAKPNQFKNRL